MSCQSEPCKYPNCGCTGTRSGTVVDVWEAKPSLRDCLAALALPAIYQHQTMLTDRAAELAYEQADEMLKARSNTRLESK